MNHSRDLAVSPSLERVPWYDSDRGIPLYSTDNRIGHCISPCSAFNHHDDLVSTTSTLGIDHWNNNFVPFPGIKLVLQERDTSHPLTRNWIRYRRMFGVYTINSVHVGMVCEAEGTRLWDRLGNYSVRTIHNPSLTLSLGRLRNIWSHLPTGD